ncbi:MAG: YkgJ family cysteine cluster protein [bacterium]
MDYQEESREYIASKLGPDYYLKDPPLLIEYDTARAQRKAKNEGLFRRLNKLYEPVPEVTCGQCGNVCCSASPDFYMLEYLNAWRFIRYELKDEALEAEIVARSVRWAFQTFFREDVRCPFLFDGKCVIYGARPFNCRVWALEDDAYYEKKAARAAANALKQEEFFERNGLRPLKPLAEFILPKCREIVVHGDGALTEKFIADIDNEVALLHRALLRPEQFRAMNFLVHFPGHIIMKQTDPLKYDETKVAVAKEFQDEGTENYLNAIISFFEGKLP